MSIPVFSHCLLGPREYVNTSITDDVMGKQALGSINLCFKRLSVLLKTRPLLAVTSVILHSS